MSARHRCHQRSRRRLATTQPMTIRRYPGPQSRAMLEELSRYVLTDPQPFVVDLERSSGIELATVDGQRIVDWASFYASRLIGYNHPHLRSPEARERLALAAATKVTNPDALTPECLAYYRLLRRYAPRCMENPRLEVYAVNSGAEAVENMMKYLVNLYNRRMLAEGRLPGTRRFVYFQQAFHGRTVFALNVTQMPHDPVVTKDFLGFVPGNLQVEFPAVDTDKPAEFNRARTQRVLETLDDVLTRYQDDVVAIIVEPIQGAGGHRVAEAEFFRGLSHVAHRHGIPLGFDEVQTAGGPTGAFFACDLFDLPHPPHAVAAAKKLGNGVVYMLHPMEDEGVLDSTWGGTLADMVRFHLEMEVVEREGLLTEVSPKAQVLVEALDDLVQHHQAVVANRRGLGLYQGFSLADPERKAALISRALQEEDLLLLGAGTHSIRLRPTLSVTEADITTLHDKLDRLLGALH